MIVILLIIFTLPYGGVIHDNTKNTVGCISGTNTKKREQFRKMIADCEAGKIDLVITKSISRFARNTQDCLQYSRQLKNLGIGIVFEKENISTMDSTGELLFTILSSLAQYHVKDDHEAIVSKELWEVVQLEIQRRKDYMKRYGLRTMGRNTDEQPFTNRVFCGVCGQLFWRRTLYRLNGSIKAWMCASKCKGKEVKGCINDTLLEADLHKAFVMAWNALLENREDFLEHWKTQLDDPGPLVVFRAKQFMKLTAKAKPMKELDVTIVSKTLDHCDIKPLGVIDFYFLDGSHIGLVTGE